MKYLIAFALLLFSSRVLADYTVGNAISDIYFEKVHGFISEFESKILNDKLSMKINDCRVYSKDNDGELHVSYRPGLGLCVFNHLLFKSQHPKATSEIETFVRFDGAREKKYQDARVVIRANITGLPKRTFADMATLDVLYYLKLKQAFERWRDTTIEIEFPWRAIPLSQIVKLGTFSDFSYNLLRERTYSVTPTGELNVDPMISKIQIKTTTVYPGEVEPVSCLRLKSVHNDATKICVELKLYGNSNFDPEFVATLEKQIGLNPEQKSIRSEARWFEIKAFAKDLTLGSGPLPFRISEQGMSDRLKAAELESELQKMQFELGINSSLGVEP